MTNLVLKNIFLTFFLGFITIAQADAPIKATKSTTTIKETKHDFQQELERFIRIFGTIQQGYVEKISYKDLFGKAIKGMVTQLDPHSSYLEPKEQENLLESSSGKFGGLGIVISMEDSLVKIISPIDDTPAYRIGLQAGDFIVKIDDISVRGLSLSESVDLMRGEPNTKVKITVLRKGIDPFEVEITRDIITIISVKGYLLEENIGYIRVSSFQHPSAKLLVKTLAKIIKKNNDNPLKGVILDLRNNPGGLLNSAVEISDLFLDKNILKENKLIVYTKGRDFKPSSEFYVKAGDILNNIPMAVLINQGSASASEIVAGALQDHKRAIIIGQQSFGKGSVQTVLSMDNGYGLKLTTARYYTPLGRSIQAEGIVPDIVLEKLSLEENKNKINLSTSENDLKGHLTKDGSKSLDKKPKTISKVMQKDNQASNTMTIEQIQQNQKDDRDIKDIKKLNADYSVNQAINALKVMRFWQK